MPNNQLSIPHGLKHQQSENDYLKTSPKNQVMTKTANSQNNLESGVKQAPPKKNDARNLFDNDEMDQVPSQQSPIS